MHALLKAEAQVALATTRLDALRSVLDDVLDGEAE